MRKYMRHLAGQWKKVSFYGCYKLEESIAWYPLSQTKGSLKNLKIKEKKDRRQLERQKGEVVQSDR